MTYLLFVGVSYTIFISTYPNIYDFWNVCEKNWNMWWKLIRISTAELCVECRVSEWPICLVVYCFLNVSFIINKMIHCYLNVDKSSKLWVLFSDLLMMTHLTVMLMMMMNFTVRIMGILLMIVSTCLHVLISNQYKDFCDPCRAIHIHACVWMKQKHITDVENVLKCIIIADCD